MPDEPEIKSLGLQAGDAPVLMQVRAMYVTQLLTTITAGTALNLQPLFQRLSPAVLQRLADLDSCLISSEAMCLGWVSALSDVLSSGAFDIKAVLDSNSIKPVTELAKHTCGNRIAQAGAHGEVDAGAHSNGANAANDETDDDAAEFTWKELFEFGASPTVPTCDQMMLLQLRIQACVIELARALESKWRGLITFRTSASQSTPDVRRKADTSFEILFCIQDKDNIVTSPTDQSLRMYRLPSDFKMVFFGTVGILAH